MASRPKRFNYNISELETNNLNLGISSMFSGSFSASNNVSSPSNVTGLSFDNSITRFFQCQITVTITKSVGSNLYELFTLEGHQTDSTWNLYATSLSDITGIQFSITSIGQVQYTSSNVSNFVSSTFRFSATQIANTGTYSTLTTATQDTYILNSLQVSNTVESIIGSSPGGLYVLGGSTFEKMISIRTTNDAIGFGTGGSLSVYGGAAISKNLLVNGNLGIGTASPQYQLDVNGDMRVSSHIYINGGMSAAAGTSSTFSYLTLTSTDDAINLSTGSLVTYGGITVQSPTDATSLTNGGSFLTDGGASISKSLFVGGTIVGLNNSNTIGNIYTTGGNVGIGITVPVHKLDVNGGIRSINFTTTNALATTVSAGTIVATTGTIPTFVATTVSTGTAVATTYTGGSIGLTGAINASTGTIGAFVATTVSAGTFVSTTSSAGTAVATTYTGGSMSLSGNLAIGGTLTTVNITTTNISETNVSAGTVSATNIGVTTQTVGTSRITVSLLSLGNSNTIGNFFTTGGNVGINTVSPGYTLDVSGTGRFTGKLTITGIAGAIGFDTATNDQYADMRVIRNSTSSIDKDMYIQLGAGATSTLHLYSNNTETMTLKSGNVGIGNASPGYKLDIAGSVYCTDWFRSGGVTGWYNQTYGRGIYMKDTTWVRTFPDGSAFACGTLNCNDITTNNNAIAMGGGTINFNNTGAGLNWGSSFSQIYDDGDLRIKTDDNMRFFSGGVEKIILTQSTLTINNNKTVNGTSINNGVTFAKYLIVPGTVLYPPSSLSTSPQTLSSQAYGNGTYYLSQSVSFNGINSGESIYQLFDGNDTGTQWTSNINNYNGAGNYQGGTTTTIDGGTYYGEWLQIQLPYAVQLGRYDLYRGQTSINRTPNIWYLAGSNDGSTWTMIDSRSGIGAFTQVSYTLTQNPSSFLYFRLVVNKNNGGDNGITSIGAWKLFCIDPFAPSSSFTANTGMILNHSVISAGSLSITGSLSKGSGTFDIEHPLDEKARLVHSFIEGPRCDLIYRGSVQLVNGTARVNIDSDCVYTSESAMRQGTFEALVANPDIFLQNKTSFDQIIGNISGNILTIISNNITSNALISWMVIGERKDSFIKNWGRTNADGYLITEYS